MSARRDADRRRSAGISRSARAIGLIALLLASLSFAGETRLVPIGKNSAAAVDFEQKLGATVPLQLPFHTARGETVTLDELLRARPTLLVAGYYHCTGLCGAVRAGVAQAVARSGLKPGRDFNVVLFSIDPHDNSAFARSVQRHDAHQFPDARVPDWIYLTGDASASAALSAAIGFRYAVDAGSGQYRHPAGIVLLTPRGQIAQYLFGVQFPARTLRLALVSASQGGIGNAVDRLLLLCSHYDAAAGRYSPLIERVLTMLCLGAAFALGAGIMLLRRGGARWRP